MFFFFLVIFYNRLSRINATDIFAGMRAKSLYKKKQLYSRHFNEKPWTPDDYYT